MAIDWTKICKKYRGRWVALKDDERTVIASGKTAREAYDLAIREGFKMPIMMRVPDEVLAFVGAV